VTTKEVLRRAKEKGVHWQDKEDLIVEVFGKSSG